jgi:hypothetical protein
MKIVKNAIIINTILFVIISASVLWCGFSEAAQPFIGVYKHGVNLDNPGIEIGLQQDQWEVQLAFTQPDTKTYRRETIQIASLSRKFQFKNVYARTGIAHVWGAEHLVGGAVNFRLGAGIELGKVQIEYMHFSSAGIHSPNYGLDMIGLRYRF